MTLQCLIIMLRIFAKPSNCSANALIQLV